MEGEEMKVEDPSQPKGGRRASLKQGEMEGKLREAEVLGGNGSDEESESGKREMPSFFFFFFDIGLPLFFLFSF